MKTIVFFGTYLSNQTGSRPSSETIAGALAKLGHRVKMVSKKSSILLRIHECIWAAFTVRADIAVLDVFSSRVHLLTSILARILAWRGIPIVSVLRGGALLEKFDEIQGSLEPILRCSTKIISPSNFLCAGFERIGYNIERVPNALDLDHFPYLERYRVEDPIRLLWVRAFTEIYRPNWPVEIVSHLHDRGISSRLIMIGPDKGLLEAAKARANELEVADSIEFVGPVPNDKLFKYFHSNDYFLNTTMYESFGVALAESAATGLPVVSASVGEVIYSWKDDANIFLVPGNSSLEFAERIAGLCESDRKGDHYRHVSRNAREKVAEFAIENIVGIWKQMIDLICNGRSN